MTVKGDRMQCDFCIGGLGNGQEDSLLEGADKISSAANSATGTGVASGGSTGTGSSNGGASSSSANGGLGMTAAQQREQDRDTAFRASTGGLPTTDQASGTASLTLIALSLHLSLLSLHLLVLLCGVAVWQQ